MLTHPWKKELTNDTTTQRKIISTTTYRSDRDSGADDVIPSLPTLPYLLVGGKSGKKL